MIPHNREQRMPVSEAAELLGMNPQLLRLGLQQGRFPFGVGVEMEQWAYYINTERFIKYMIGETLHFETRQQVS